MEAPMELSRAEKDRYIAYVGMYADSNAAIWGQYDRIVNYIFDSYPKINSRIDPIAVPLLNTMAHGIELGLKESIAFFHTYHESVHLKNFDSWVALEKSHDLDLLAEEFKIGYFKLFDKFGLDQDDREEFNKYYKPLEELLGLLERSAETFRYATKMDKQGAFVKFSVDRHKTFDLLHIKALFDEVNTLFLGAPNSLGSYTDFIDFQRGNEHYDAGIGHLYVQRLTYSEHFLEQTKDWLDERMNQFKPGLWFDDSTGTNYEIQVWNRDIYIIAVDPGKVLKRKMEEAKAELKKEKKVKKSKK